MKIVALTALWRRHPLTRLMLQRLHTQGIGVLAVGSEGTTSRELAEACGAHYVERPNSPLSKKWNHGLQATRALDPDAILILGSDDFVSDSLLQRWAVLAEDHPYIGLLDFFVYTTPDLLHWPGYTVNRKGEPIGAGRCLRRDLLDELDWQLWTSERDRTLDLEATQRLAEHGAAPHCLRMFEHDVWLVDVKTTTCITHLDALRPSSVALTGALLDQHFGSGFRQALDRAIEASAAVR